MKCKINRNQGFTLIEILVAVSIFAVVISVVLGLFTTGIQGQRKIIALQNVQDNANFLLGFMAKEIRMSKINSVTSDTLNITRPDGEVVSYFFDNDNGEIERTDSISSGPINSAEVLVTGSFYGDGIGSGDSQQPKITIAMKVKTVGGKVEQEAEINLQTTLSARDLEF
jgi:prepilin-type N-terminal cleavage/methylation domain-containing protein